MTGSDGRPVVFAEPRRMAYLLAIEHLNEDIDGGPHSFQADPICDTEQTVLTGYMCAEEMRGLLPVGIIGGHYSSITLHIAVVATEYRLLQCSPEASSPDLSRYPYFFRLVPSDDAVAVTTIAMLIQFNWWRAAVIHNTDRWGAGLAEQLALSAQRAKGAGMQLSYYALQPSFHTTLSQAVQGQLKRDITFGIRSSQVKIFILALGEGAMEVMLRWSWESGLLAPDYAWIGYDIMTHLDRPRFLQLMDTGLLPARDEYSNFLSITQKAETTARTARLQASVHQKFNTTLDSISAMRVYDCVVAIGTAAQSLLRQNHSLSAADLVGSRSAEVAEQLRNAAFSLEFEGASGWVRFRKVEGGQAAERVPFFSIAQWDPRGFFRELGVHNITETGNSSVILTRPVNFSGAPALADSSSCQAGTEFNATLSFAAKEDVCQPCPLGRYKRHQQTETCLACPPGFRCGDSDGTREPRRCETGHFSMEGAPQCRACAPGSYTSTPASSQCLQCPSGYFQDSSGERLCDACPVGFFQPESGSTGCKACPETQSTEAAASRSRRSCGCPANFRWAADVGRCLECQHGMLDCQHFNATPLVMPGHYLEERAPRDLEHIELFRCSIARWCPGEQEPGDPICSETREGLNCGRCAQGFFEAGQACHRCTGLHSSLYLLGTLGLFVGTGLALHLGDRQGDDDARRQGRLFLSIIAGTSLAVAQRLGTIGRTSAKWPPGVQGTLMVSTEVFFSNTPVLTPPCALPSSLFTMYFARLCAPLLFVLSCVLWWGLSQLMHHFFSKRVPAFSVFHVVNTSGLCISALYIFTVMGTLSLVDCYENPNGKRTIREFSFALCSGPDFNSALPLFMLGVLIYIVGVVGVTLYALWIAPKRYEKGSGFRVMIQFLVAKFRPEKYWYGLVTMLSSFLMALVTVVFPDNELWQLICMQVIASFQFCAHCRHMPYPRKSANILVNLQHLGLVVLLFLGTHFHEPPQPSSSAHLAHAMQGLLLLMAGLALCGVGWGLCLALCPCRIGLKEQAGTDVDRQFCCILAGCERILDRHEAFRQLFRESTSYVERDRAVRISSLQQDRALGISNLLSDATVAEGWRLLMSSGRSRA